VGWARAGAHNAVPVRDDVALDAREARRDRGVREDDRPGPRLLVALGRAVKGGVPQYIASSLTDADLPYRDHALRSNLFSPEVDPVWADVSRLLDADTVMTIRRRLINNDV